MKASRGRAHGGEAPEMRDPNYLLVIDVLLAGYVAYDLRRVLTTGHARVWLGGTVTREHQPARYWRYVYSSWGMLAACFGLSVAVILWPDFFR